jgi:serine phosphatase RsbU (regulator of sigma subunit)
MGMRRALHQDSEASQGSQEALQIALLAYEPEAHELSFAGAQLSLYVLKRGTLEEIKGDSYPIGGEQEEAFRIFTNHRMALWGNEQLFLTTDGLARQAGGEEGKPYGQQGIKKLLGDLAGYEPEQQRQMIQEALQAWQNGYARTDDIAVLSFRP